MGVNMYAYYFTGRDSKGYQTTRRHPFESRGERAFLRNNDIEWESVLENPDRPNEIQACYSRPEDLEKAKEAAIKYGRQDIADLFEEMKTNPNLWVEIIY